jgi:hypothetical protein
MKNKSEKNIFDLRTFLQYFRLKNMCNGNGSNRNGFLNNFDKFLCSSISMQLRVISNQKSAMSKNSITGLYLVGFCFIASAE